LVRRAFDDHGQRVMSSTSKSILRLRAMGFCGADDSVEPSRLHEISKSHPHAEWGVLFREELQGTPRYASWEWLQKLAVEAQGSQLMRTAAHLCGGHVGELLQGNPDFVSKLHGEYGFRRVQINPTAVNGVESSDLGPGVEGLRAVLAAVPSVEFIVQVNEETSALWQPLVKDPPSNMALLFDESKGLGALPTHWPQPQPNIPCGYAGGLGFDNVERQLRLIADAASGTPVWIDSETSLRSMSGSDDIFDLDKVQQMLQALDRLEDEYEVVLGM